MNWIEITPGNWITVNTDSSNSGNCGTGAGGFKSGNTCGGSRKKTQFSDPTGFCPPRRVTPKFGYHVTAIEHVKSIAQHGLIPMRSSTGGGGSGGPEGVYFSDKLYPKGHKYSPEVGLSPSEVSLRVRIPNHAQVLDDTEVREFNAQPGEMNYQDKWTGDPNKNIGEKSAFILGEHVPPDQIEALVPSSGSRRKWIPLQQFISTKEFELQHKQHARYEMVVRYDENGKKVYK